MAPSSFRAAQRLTLLVVAAVSTASSPAAERAGLPSPLGVVYRPAPVEIYVVGPDAAYSADTRAVADFFNAVSAVRVDTAISRRIGPDAGHNELEYSESAAGTNSQRKLLHEQRWRRLAETQPQGDQAPQVPGDPPDRADRGGNDLAGLDGTRDDRIDQRFADNTDFFSAVTLGDGEGADLSVEELRHVRRLDRPGAGPRFHFGEATGAREHWPHALRDAAFDEARREFEERRDELLRELHRTGARGVGQNVELKRAWENLTAKFDDAYRAKLGTSESPRPADYAEALRFLRSQRSEMEQLQRGNHVEERHAYTEKALSALDGHLRSGGESFAHPTQGESRRPNVVYHDAGKTRTGVAVQAPPRAVLGPTMRSGQLAKPRFIYSPGAAPYASRTSNFIGHQGGMPLGVRGAGLPHR
jgi:hypothetical protein